MASGSVQTGPIRVVVEEVDSKGIHYRVEADVVRRFGDRPKPNAVWIETRGISPDATLTELKERYRAGKTGLFHFDGPESEWPYIS